MNRPPAQRSGLARLRGLLGVEAREVSPLLAVCALAVLGALTRVYLFSVTNALFLTEFSAGQLGWVYVAGAVIVGVGGLGYRALASRVSLAGLMLGLVSIMGLGVVGLRLGLSLDGPASRVALFMLPTWFHVSWIYGWVVLWGFAKHIFDLRQAKRLFGLIGAGEALGEIVGGLSVAPLVHTLGATDTLWVSVALFGAQLVLIRHMLVRFASRPPADPRPTTPTREGSPRRRYVALIIALSSCTMIAYWSLELLFMTQVQWMYGPAEQAATFLGRLFGLVAVTSFLLRTLASGPLLSRFGLRFGLVILPATMLSLTLAISVIGGLGGQTRALAVAVVVAFVGWRLVRDALDKPSALLLYQVLPHVERLRVQVMVETETDSLAAIFAGVSLVLLTRASSFDPGWLAAWMAGLMIVWGAVALWILATYPRVLHALVRRRFGGPGPGAGAASQAELLRDLHSREHVVRSAAARALGDEPPPTLVVDANERALVDEAIDDALDRAERSARLLTRASARTDAQLLVWAHELELRHARRQVGLSLSLVYDPRVRDALFWIELGEPNLAPMAHELLEAVLPKRHRRRMLALLSGRPIARARGREHGLTFEEHLWARLRRGPELSDWTRACIVRWLVSEHVEVTALVAEFGSDRAAIVREATLVGLAGRTDPGLALTGRVLILVEALAHDVAPEVRRLATWLSDHPTTNHEPPMLTTIDRVLFLRDTSFFAECSDDVLADVARSMIEERFEPGARIIEQGSGGTTMYVIVSGTVRIEIDHRAMRSYGPGEVFGELAALAPALRTATCIADGEVSVLVLDHWTLLDLIQAQVAVGAGVIRFLCQRIRTLTPTPRE